MRPRLRLALSELNPVKLLTLFLRVIQHLTGNINFATPKVPLAAMQTMADDLQSAIIAAQDGNTESRQLRDQLVKQAKAMLRLQGNYITMEADGNGAKLASSGFLLAKQPTPYPTPEVPQNVQASTGSDPGEVDVRFNLSPGAHNYGIYKSESDPDLGAAEWVLVTNTTRGRNTITGLVTFKPYWFRVVAIGVSGTSIMSNASLAVAA